MAEKWDNTFEKVINDAPHCPALTSTYSVVYQFIVHCGSERLPLIISLPNVHRFWRFFHHHPYSLTATTTVILLPFNGLFSRTTWVSQYQKGRSSLDLYEARDDEVLGCSGISWTVCKQSAPHCRHTSTPSLKFFLTPNQQCQALKADHT